MSTNYVVRAIDPAVVDEVRQRDDAGRAPVPVVDERGGSPLRCCLRKSRPGERLLLLSFAPLRRWAAQRGVSAGPYDEVGPVFVHAEPCPGPTQEGYPVEFRGQPRVLRGYDDCGRIVDGHVVDADEDVDPAIRKLFDDPRVAVIHARAVVFGCFTFAIHRVDA